MWPNEKEVFIGPWAERDINFGIGAAIKMDVDKKQTNKNNDQKKLKPIANFRTL